MGLLGGKLKLLVTPKVQRLSKIKNSLLPLDDLLIVRGDMV